MRGYFLNLLICLLLIISTFAVYIQVLNNEFVDYDDDLYITDNRHVQAELTSESITWAFTSTFANFWHPLTWLSYILDFQLYGLNPKGYHLTNLLFHIANTLLLFVVLKRVTNAVWCSAFVAVLFALHPLHVESVAWASERKDDLSTFFWMLTLWFYASYSEKPTLQKYFMMLLAFVLGLMAKPMLVVLPFTLLLLDYWPLGNFQFKKSMDADKLKTYRFMSAGYRRSHPLWLIWEKAPFFILSAVSCIVTFLIQQKAGVMISLESLSLKMRISNALVAYVTYIGKMIWPSHLAVLFPRPGTLAIWQVVSAGLLLISIFVLVVRAARQFPYLAVGWMWYLGTLVPVIGLVQIGSHSMADRYTYVSLIGLFIIIAWGISDLSTKWRYRKPVLTILTGILLSFLMINTWFQVRIWRNSQSLFEHAINVTDNNYVIYNGLGVVLAKQGKFEEAISRYRESLRINPNFSDAHYNLGITLFKLGKTDKSIYYLREAQRIKPYHADAHSNLGNALAKQGKFDEAVEHFIKALRIKPHDATAHYNLGLALDIQGKVNEAIAHYSEALRLKPDLTLAKKNLEALKPNHSISK